jgi:hypothetical protein
MAMGHAFDDDLNAKLSINCVCSLPCLITEGWPTTNLQPLEWAHHFHNILTSIFQFWLVYSQPILISIPYIPT